ncbi:hypothetical protein HU200_016599 [Digitaria exilis]|uniref:CCHC-type domain-containing protein n=1 Tax=Digitaria exilis TaxID=1010633 RepID=A0A835KKJ9_9POAL|nr:hypothetical protein HU200_016599 [Digitaria exilis]
MSSKEGDWPGSAVGSEAVEVDGVKVSPAEVNDGRRIVHVNAPIYQDEKEVAERRRRNEVIDSIALWVRFYDIPEGLMTNRFMRAPGSKIGKVLEVGDARLDYKRVKIDFQLANAIKPMINILVKEFGRMEFLVRYENIPRFCFVCGRIDHAARECPEEGDGNGGVRFDKVAKGSEDEAADLAKGVASMSVDSKDPKVGKEKVSRLDSFRDSGSDSGAIGGGNAGFMSMQDRLKLGKGYPDPKGVYAGSTKEAMEIDRQKRGKMQDADGSMGMRS